LNVYPKGQTDPNPTIFSSREDRVALFLHKLDDYKGTVTCNVELTNGEAHMSFPIFFSQIDVGAGFGRKYFAKTEELYSAAQKTEGGAVEFRVQLSAPRSNRKSLASVVTGYA